MNRLPGPIDRPQTFSGRSVEVLREMVLDGRLRPGDRLNEVELAAALGISRGPLREAIQRLCSEGLLTAITNRGAYVRIVSAPQLREIYEVRIALETHAVRLLATGAAVRDDPGAPASASGSLASGSSASGSSASGPSVSGPSVSGSSVSGSSARDPELAFHRRLVGLTANGALLAATVVVHRQIELAGAHRAPGFDRGDPAGHATEHDEMLEQIRAGRGDRAAVILTRHLRSSLRHALLLLDNAVREL